jgi:hypothetical protein
MLMSTSCCLSWFDLFLERVRSCNLDSTVGVHVDNVPKLTHASGFLERKLQLLRRLISLHFLAKFWPGDSTGWVSVWVLNLRSPMHRGDPWFGGLRWVIRSLWARVMLSFPSIILLYLVTSVLALTEAPSCVTWKVMCVEWPHCLFWICDSTRIWLIKTKEILFA